MSRAVVTGIGVVAPTGVGAGRHWESVRANRLRVTALPEGRAATYGVSLAGQVPQFTPDEHVDERLLVQTDRWTWFSLAAVRMALDDSGFDPAVRDPYSVAVSLAAASGGNEFGQREMTSLYTQGPKAVTAYQSIAWFYAASTGQASIRHGLKGSSSVLVTEGAGGLDSIGHARRVIRRGTGSVLAGGTEAGLSPYALACQAAAGRMSPKTAPTEAYTPFDVRASGFVPGEGGAVLLIEDDETTGPARRVYGEIAGYAATHDGETDTRSPAQFARAMRLALADAGVGPGDVDLVIADAAGDAIRDRMEIEALQAVFGDREIPVPVAAPQALVGRLSVGGSALAAATALLCIRDGLLPAVGNLRHPVHAPGLELVRTPRSAPVGTVLVNARGLGGFNSCLVLRRYHPEG
ncbi:ketosynthase chain-length factor [Kineosporia sp. J2-2]|uniref:Ketosynthase chain-length factor n=1 Tax=Kineosporia corallincola TaxID=2835133 RepID=A0ABS5TIV6_9ACTN|nr:beta-ketoacyl synthase N-terminal-like domain-containing protein [Kineosporia corallincola]MBT0769509.1 ketosynthase chain-length factor [Kineosporia corallincola]